MLTGIPKPAFKGQLANRRFEALPGLGNGGEWVGHKRQFVRGHPGWRPAL